MEDEQPLSFRLELTATLYDLGRVRQFVEDTAAGLGFADAAHLLSLAVDEAVTNIVVHGYRGQHGPVEIAIGLVGGALHIRLRDQARPFDPTRVPPPDLTVPLEHRALGGLGVHLMREIADEMIYRPRPGGGNELTLVKRRPRV